VTRRTRRAGSRRWLQEHFDDGFVRRAQKEGYRSRAAYKLMEIDRRDRLLRPGAVVVDLGAAPGGWSQYARRRVGPAGRVVAVDLLPVGEMEGVDVLQGDFTTPDVVATLQARLGGCTADLVMSDMAPNISGVAAVDQARAAGLVEQVLAVLPQLLAAGGAALIKVFQGPEFDALRRRMAGMFERVAVRKPEASRSRSAEVYLLGTGFRGAER